jgi:hypothetical protein
MGKIPLIKVNDVEQSPILINEDSSHTYYRFAFQYSALQKNRIFFEDDTVCDILLVGGGGGGAGAGETYSATSGGGGAGAVVFIKSVRMNANYDIYVGNGGAGGSSVNLTQNGKRGETTTISSITNNNSIIILSAFGGGGGKIIGDSTTDVNGGSGGGVSYNISLGGTTIPLNSIIKYNDTTGVRYGNRGGNRLGVNTTSWSSSGGGGAGAPGQNGNTTPGVLAGGNGGDGIFQATVAGINYNFVTVFGTTVHGIDNDGDATKRYFGGGGGGGGFGEAGSGGKGGGGGGRGRDGAAGNPGSLGTGGGGGGVYFNGAGGNGGTGIVLIKFAVIKSFTVTFNANGKGTGKTVTQDYNTSVSLPTLKAVGWVFGGWATNSTATTADVTAAFTMPVNGRTLHAVWTENTGGMVSFSELQAVYGGEGKISISDYRVQSGQTTPGSIITLGTHFKGKGPAPP